MIKDFLDGRVGVLIATLVFFILLYPLTKPFPYSDDWMYIGFIVDPMAISLPWLFSLHNDHRIPLQKILQLGLLIFNGGDFRILIAANVVIVAATCVCWIMLSRLIFNGRSRSEWLVPFILLGLGFNTVAWGFSFQFLSGLFFLAVANLLWARSVMGGRDHLGAGTYIALTLCALCGGNGLVTSTIVGFGFLCAIFFLNGPALASWLGRSSLFLWGMTTLLLWMGWTSSSATDVSVRENQQYIDFGLGMLKSWLGISAMSSPIANTLISVTLLIVGFCGSLVILAKAKAENSKGISRLVFVPVFLSIVQTIAMIVAVTYSRAGSQPWWPGLELHYGYLVTAIPLATWIVILLFPKGLVRNSVLAVFAFAVGLAYVSGADWRIRAAQEEYRRGAATVADILSPVSANIVSQRHLQEFYWVQGETAEIAVSDGLSLLRRTRFWSPRSKE